MNWYRSPYRPAPWVAMLLSAGLTVVGGCSAGGENAAEVRVDTLASGTIVVRNQGDGVWSAAAAWTVIELTRIGSADGADPAPLFGDVWDVTLDAFGRIYVLDRQSKEVRVFDSGSLHIRTLGGEGGGPGELLNPIGLAWGPEGNLWVVDAGNARYAVFDTAGRYIDSYRRKIGSWGYGWGGGFDGAGRLHEPSVLHDPATGESRGVYIRHAVADEVAGTDTFELPRYDAAGSSHRIEMHGGGYAVVGVPFAPRLTWRFDGASGIWFGVNEAYRLYHRSLEGDTMRVVERHVEPMRVENSDREAVRERFTRYGEQATNAIIARIPEMKPEYESFVVDDGGYLWVIRTSTTQQDISLRHVTFDVFDPEGRYLGALDVDVGRNPSPRIVADHLVGVTRDESDTQYVVLYRIEGRHGS